MGSRAPDVLVVGSGQAGVPLTIRLAGAGRNVVLVERSVLGGTCVNTGCTPTKTMIASARAAHAARTAGRLGVRTAEVTVDLPAIVERKDAIVRRWREGVGRRLQAAGARVQVRRGHARFTGPGEIDVFDRLVGRGARGRASRLIPFAVFTDPQVAGVGFTEREARARGLAYEVATMSFGTIARAIEVDERAGTMKILLDPRTERILGCRLVGADAGELIHVFVALLQAGATARAIVDAEFVHPTFAEGLQSLVMRLDRYALR